MPFVIGPKIHNTIQPLLRRLIEQFFSIRDWDGLFLTGGTCLAEYYFGHRLSVDIDLFTADEGLFQEAGRSLLDPRGFQPGVMEVGLRSAYFARFLYREPQSKEPVKVELVLDPVSRISPPIKIGKVWIDSLDDILANKLGCLVSRNEVKDYGDLFYLVPASHLTTKELIVEGQKKEAGLDPLILAHQMEFLFKSGPPDPRILGKTDWEELKLFFKKFQKESLELIRPKV